MNISSNLNGSNVTIKNILGDEKNISYVYIDSSNNLVLKTEPIENRSKLISTSARDNSVSSTFDSTNNTVSINSSILTPGTRTVNIAKRRGFGSYWLNFDSVTTGRTGVVRVQAPQGVIGCYLNFQHYGDNPADIDKAGILAVPNTSGNTGIRAFQQATFNGSISGVVQPWIAGSYPPSYRYSPNFLRSDFIALSAMSRTDYPNRGPVFDVAFKVGSRAITAGVHSPTDSGNTPWVLGWTNTSTDLIATPVSTTMYQYMATYVWVEWVYSGQRLPLIAAYGDSIFDGLAASAISDGYLQNACFSNGYELYLNAVGGRTTFDTYDALRREIPGLAKDIDGVFLTCWSPNDEINGYSASATFSRYLTEKSWLESMGIKVLTVGPIPFQGSTNPKYIRDRLINTGIEFFDAGIYLSTNSSISAFISGTSNDNIHPNDTGYSILTNALRPWAQDRIQGKDTYRVFNSYSDLPNGIRKGQLASVNNLSNNGTFQVEWDGTRWFVRPHENIISDGTERNWVTSAGDIGVWKDIASYTIPAGLIGDKEHWSYSFLVGQSGGVSAGINCLKLVDGTQDLLSSNYLTISQVPYTYDMNFRRFRRSGNSLKRNAGAGTETYGNSEVTVSVDHSQSQALKLQQKATNSGEVWYYTRFILKREG